MDEVVKRVEELGAGDAEVVEEPGAATEELGVAEPESVASVEIAELVVVVDVVVEVVVVEPEPIAVTCMYTSVHVGAMSTS